MNKKYQEIYDIDVEEAEFFCDLEKILAESIEETQIKLGFMYSKPFLTFLRQCTDIICS